MECGTLEPDHYCEHPATASDMEEPEEALGRIIGEFVFDVAQYKGCGPSLLLRRYAVEAFVSVVRREAQDDRGRSGVLHPRPSSGSHHYIPEKRLLHGKTRQTESSLCLCGLRGKRFPPGFCLMNESSIGPISGNGWPSRGPKRDNVKR